MPLALGPVVLHPSGSTAAKDNLGHTRKQAIIVKLPEETARALKAAAAAFPPNSQSGISAGASPLKVSLSDDKRGFYINGQFFPLSLDTSTSHAQELFVRTRHEKPTKPMHHRPPLYFAAPIFAKATVTRVLDDDVGQKVRERKAEVEQQRKDRHIQMIDVPPVSSKSGKGTTARNKRKSAATSTASSLARNVLQKGVAAQAKNEGSVGLVASTSSSASTPRSQSPASTAIPAIDTTSLKSRVIHRLAQSSCTSKELRVALGDVQGLDDVLRIVAIPDSKGSASSSAAFSTPTNYSGRWRLKSSVYADSVHPYTWPGYDSDERERIAEDVIAAFDELGYPDNSPDRDRLRRAQSSFFKRRKLDHANGIEGTPDSRAVKPGHARSASNGSASATARKVKMNKMSEPPSMGGGTLTGNVRPGVVKTATNGASSSKGKGISTGATSKKGSDGDRGSGRDSDIETKRTIPKRSTPPNPASGRATPGSTSSSGSSSSALPLAHGLPPKPTTSLAPPNKPNTQRKSITPPPPRPSSTQPSRVATPNASPFATTGSGKKKLDDLGSDLDDSLLYPPPKKNGIDKHVSSASAGDKKRRPEPIAAASTSSTVKKTSSVPNAKSKPSINDHDSTSRDASLSSGKTSQTLKPPINLTNGKSPSSSSSRLSSSSNVHSKKEHHPSPLPHSKDREISPSGSTIETKKVHSSSSKVKRPTPTWSSDEEEEEVLPAGPPVKKKTKVAASPSSPSKSRPHPAPSRWQRLPSPLPTDRQELRLLYSELYAESTAVWAELTAEKARVERYSLGMISSDRLWTKEELESKAKEYTRFQSGLQKIQDAFAVLSDAQSGDP